MTNHLPDGYEFIQSLGKGTFGEVSLVRSNDRLLALKRYSFPMQAAELPEKLVREFEVTRSFRHPGLVRSADLGTYQVGEERFAYLVMEYVEGQPLHKLTLPLEPAAALDIIVDVAEALGEAATAGVVHRDIKPGNILLTAERAVVVDFGMARLLDENWAETTIHQPGSLSYCSPHNYYDASTANEGDDIFSLGCVLYFLLTGKPAFWIDAGEGSIGKLREKVNEGTYAPLGPNIPPEYHHLVQRMIAGTKDGHPNYATWNDFLDDIVQFFPLSRRQPYALFPGGLLTLRVTEYQTLIHRIYALTNAQRRPEEIMLRMLSSAGELGILLRKPRTAASDDALRNELASFFCWLLALADATGIDLETAIWTKFPCVCPYCGQRHATPAAVAACKADERAFRPAFLILTADRNKTRRPQNLLQWELHLREIYPLTYTEGEAFLIAKLLEELAEVGALLSRPQERHATLRDYYADPLAFELADVFAWICLCSRRLAATDNESPLAVEMAKEYRSETCRRCHRAPCMCDPEHTTRRRSLDTTGTPRPMVHPAP